MERCWLTKLKVSQYSSSLTGGNDFWHFKAMGGWKGTKFGVGDKIQCGNGS